VASGLIFLTVRFFFPEAKRGQSPISSQEVKTRTESSLPTQVAEIHAEDPTEAA